MELKLFSPPPRKFWLCRAETGKHLPHFIKHQLIAMSHFDSITRFPSLTDPAETSVKLQHFLEGIKVKQKTATNHVNQALHFVYDASEGDIVLSVDHGTIAIGTITSDAYFEKKQLYVPTARGKNKEISMNSFLRRSVKWAGYLKRTELPFNLYRGITAQQTFYSLDEYQDEIYSMVSPFVIRDNQLTTNLLIKNPDSISTYHYALLTRAFLKAEFISRKLDLISTADSVEQIEQMFEDFCRTEVTSSLKAEFASPGWTTNKLIVMALSSTLFMAGCSAAINGGSIDTPIFKAELKGALNNEVVARFAGKAGDILLKNLDKWLTEDSDEMLEKIQLQEPGRGLDLNLLEKAPEVRIAEEMKKHE